MTSLTANSFDSGLVLVLGCLVERLRQSQSQLLAHPEAPGTAFPGDSHSISAVNDNRDCDYDYGYDYGYSYDYDHDYDYSYDYDHDYSYD